jgi:flagellar L-ring protein precursor FlgH
MRRWVLAGLALLAAAAPVGRADSIWDRRDPRYANLFQDNRARNIGDVLVVTITENTVANEQDQRAMTKTTSAMGQFSFGNSGRPGQLLTSDSNRQFTGNAQLTSNRVFTDRMAVTVVDVMPNGNLVVEGYRSRVVQGEEWVLRITGVVRPADIGAGNIVPSGAIANFRVSYLGRGPETRFTKQGYSGRFFNLIWPW